MEQDTATDTGDIMMMYQCREQAILSVPIASCADCGEDVLPNAACSFATRQRAQHSGFGAAQYGRLGSCLTEMHPRIAFDLLANRVTAFEVQAPPRRFRSISITGSKDLDTIVRQV